MFLPTTESDHTIRKCFGYLQRGIHAKSVVEVCRLYMISGFAKVHFVGQRGSPIDRSSEAVERVVVLIIGYFANNGAAAIFSNEVCCIGSVWTTNWQQLVEVPDGEANAIHVREDDCAGIPEFQHQAILQCITGVYFRLDFPFPLRLADVLQQEFLHGSFVAGRRMQFAQLLQ